MEDKSWGEMMEEEASLEADSEKRNVTWAKELETELGSVESTPEVRVVDEKAEWELVNFSSGYLYLPVCVAGKEIFALVDSGSMHSIISV